MFNDQDPSQPQAQPAQPSGSQPATVTYPGTPASTPASQSSTTPAQASPQTTAQPSRQQTAQTQQANSAQAQTVSNPGASQQQGQKHPLASRIRGTAEVLAGGPQFTINDQGQRVPQPLSPKHIAMAIALEALAGGFTGLAAGRGRGAGMAGAAGFAKGQEIGQQQREQEQQDFNNRSAALARQANIYEINSRTLLNTSESEKFGSDAIDKLIDINRASGVLDVDPGALDNNGQPMTQDELMDAMKSGKVSATDQLGPIAGRVEVMNPDGTKRWEATHLIIKDPQTPVMLTQDDWNRYAAAHVKGFPAGTNIGATGVEVPLRMKQLANEQLAAHTLADFRLKDMRDTLAGTQWADKVPSKVDFLQPGIDTAMQRFQKYVSHSNQHGMDVYEALQQMGSDKRNPQTGQMQPNSDAKYVETVAQALGGWGVLEAAHNQLAANKKNAEEFSIIDSEAKANAILASPNKFTQDQVQTAKSFLKLSEDQGAKKAAQDAKERAVGEGKDVETMYKTGINPITKERLTLDNAPDSMLVDSKGRPVPQNQQTLYKPSQMERQTADTARQALAISAGLRSAVQKNPNLVGPLLGRSEKGLASLGFGNAEAQKLLNDVSFLQSAATKVHTGRFSNEILKKMSGMIQPGMNTQQFLGGLDSIDEVMGRYAKEDQLVTVADFKAMQQGATNPVEQSKQAPPQGATMKVPGSDGKLHWSDGKQDLGVVQ